MEALIFALLVAGIAGRRTLSDIPFMVRGQTPPSHERRMTEMAHRETAANRKHQRRMTRVQRPHPARAYWSALWGHAWQRAAEKRRDRWEVRDPAKAQQYRNKLQQKVDGTYRGPTRRALDRGKTLHQRAKETVAQRSAPVYEQQPTPNGTEQSAAPDTIDDRSHDSQRLPVYGAGQCQLCGETPSEDDPLAMSEHGWHGHRSHLHDRNSSRERLTDGSEHMPWLCRRAGGCTGQVHGTGTYRLDDGRIRLDGACDSCGDISRRVLDSDTKTDNPSTDTCATTETADNHPSPNGTSERTPTMTAAPSEATGVDEFSAALEQMVQQLDGLVPACDGLAASAQQQHVGPSVTDPLARAQEMAPQLVACFEESREGLQQSVNVGESYAANQDAGDAAFVTNGARP